jgi:hypothetical protein
VSGEPVRRVPSGDRDETPAERLDRNWSDLLQELRVMQTGTQIVTAFLMTLPFQSQFAELAGDLTVWYLALLVAAVLLTTLMLLPVVIHRRFFRQHHKDRTVAFGNRVVKICLVGMALLLAGCVGFIAHALVDPEPAWWITAITTVLIVVLMGVLPAMLRPGPGPGTGDGTAAGRRPRSRPDGPD